MDGVLYRSLARKFISVVTDYFRNHRVLLMDSFLGRLKFGPSHTAISMLLLLKTMACSRANKKPEPKKLKLNKSGIRDGSSSSNSAAIAAAPHCHHTGCVDWDLTTIVNGLSDAWPGNGRACLTHTNYTKYSMQTEYKMYCDDSTK